MLVCSGNGHFKILNRNDCVNLFINGYFKILNRNKNSPYTYDKSVINSYTITLICISKYN